MISQDYVDRILDACPIEVYLSANDGAQTSWPFRMQPTHEANYRYADIAETFVVDSAWQKPELGNRDALDKGAELGADVVVLADVFGDCDATVDALLEGLEVADDHEFGGKLMLPLQPPHDKCYLEIGDHDDVWWAIGGVKDWHATEKVQAAETLRGVAGDVRLHGLGWGATDEVVRAVRENPSLVDSIDSRSSHADAMEHPVWPGSERSTVTAVHCVAHLLEACRRMSPELSEDPDAGNQTLEAWA